MPARQELNKFHIVGGLGLAAILGGLAGSWAVFFIAAVVLIGSSLYVGEIRRSKAGRW